MGLASAYGLGLDVLVEGIRSGRQPTSDASDLGLTGERSTLLARVPMSGRAPGEAGYADLLLATVEQALAGLDDRDVFSAADCALVVGTGGFLYASNAERYWRDRQAQRHGESFATPFRVRGPSWGAGLIRGHFAMRGPVVTLSTGCSSSANALLVAHEMITGGQIRRAVVIGAEGANAVTIAGFDALMLLDPRGCRPFDRDRQGLRLGDGVGVILLEAVDSAEAAWPRTGDDRPFLLGGANACDTHHLTSANPDGSVMASVMLAALTDAMLTPAQVEAIKAHGTGSVDSDAAEAQAIHQVFGATPPAITALKPWVGHTLGACGVLESVAWLACLQAGFMPPVAGFSSVDPALAITPLTRVTTAPGGPCLLNFFGFGGNYTALVMAGRIRA